MIYDKAAEHLFHAKNLNKPADNFSDELMPKSISDAYNIQNKLLSLISLESVGWKIGCTTNMAQKFSGIDEPFYGKLLKKTTYDSPKILNIQDFNLPIIEPELCFRIGKNFSDSESPFDKNITIDKIDSICPAIEIVDARYNKGWKIKALESIADNGVHASIILGDTTYDWKTYDRIEGLMTLNLNGKKVAVGKGKNVLSDPINAITWLANTLYKQGLKLSKGDIVTTGNVCDKVIYAKKNDLIEVIFENLGEVKVSF